MSASATQVGHKKLKPGLVASYDIWPGNGEGLFWFQRFIKLSLTYLLKTFTQLLTAPNDIVLHVITADEVLLCNSS